MAFVFDCVYVYHHRQRLTGLTSHFMYMLFLFFYCVKSVQYSTIALLSTNTKPLKRWFGWRIPKVFDFLFNLSWAVPILVLGRKESLSIYISIKIYKFSYKWHFYCLWALDLHAFVLFFFFLEPKLLLPFQTSFSSCWFIISISAWLFLSPSIWIASKIPN